MDLPLRTATADDYEAIAALLGGVFHTVYDEEELAVERPLHDPTRSLVVTDGDEIVGHAAAFDRQMTVPGAVLPCAHVTGVGVAPTHRRRGILRSLMTRQLRDTAAAGREPIAALWASESAIYPRFGYGYAGGRLRFEARVPDTGFPAPGVGRLRAASPAAVRSELVKVYDEARATRPGWSSRDENWWTYLLADTASRRDGFTPLRAILHEDPEGTVDGYALWRSQRRWTDRGPEGEVQIQELAALGPDAYRELWRFLLSIDLVRTVTYGMATPDEPLLHLVPEPRHLGATLADALWVRVVSLPEALRARSYRTPFDVVIEVTDPLLPENAGRWRVTPDACDRTTAPADLACDILDLGAVYLGGTSLSTLARAGRVRELRRGALSAVDTAFGWDRAPCGSDIF